MDKCKGFEMFVFVVGTFALRSVQFGTYAWAMDITRPSSDEEGQGILSRWRVFGAQWNTLVSGAIAGYLRWKIESSLLSSLFYSASGIVHVELSFILLFFFLICFGFIHG